MPQDSQDMQNFLQNLTEVITENKNVPEQTQKQTDVEADSVTDTSAVTVSQDESVPVTVEVSNESGQSDAFAQDSQTGSQPAAEAENSLPAFVDRLTQAFEPGTENAEIRSGFHAGDRRSGSEPYPAFVYCHRQQVWNCS